MPQVIRLDAVSLAAVATAPTTDTLTGAVDETAPTTDIASSGLNGRLQRIAQRLTSLIALFPASIGQTTKAASLSVSLASDDNLLAINGAVNETAPASDTASSGLNGRLQRIAQRLTSLNPTALGKGVASGAFLVTDALDNGPDTTYRLLTTAATTNGANIKASAGVCYQISGNNTVASKKYIKLYNKATAPTVGTDVPVMTIAIPVSAAFSIDLRGRYFPLGIGIAITAAAADADVAAIGAGDIECINLLYR